MATRPNLQCALLASFVALALPTLAAPIEDELVTRTYKLDIAKIQKLSETTLAEFAPAPKTSPSNLLRALFAQDGITFPTHLITTNVDSFKNEKAFYYNKQTGELHLRATRRDIPKFEKHLAELSPDAPPVKTETIWVKIPSSHFSPVGIPILQPGALFTNLIEQPSILTYQWRRISVPVGLNTPSFPPSITSVPVSSPTLIIRSESDLR